MLLSKSCVYGLRASIYLASKSEGEFISIKGMSANLEISFHFLTMDLNYSPNVLWDCLVVGQKLLVQSMRAGLLHGLPYKECWIELL